MALSNKSISLDDPVLKAQDRLAVIMGTEGEGLPQATIDQADFTVRIPMYHQVDSLNVAAAAAVAFWELRK
jgi:tRNA G18 (ribose-2'-O)-methylase SpoU